MNFSGFYKGIAFIVVFFFLTREGFGQLQTQAYGLRFSSHEVVPEKRTALVLTNAEPICFSNQLDLSFDLNFLDDHITYFGYIFRLINDKGQNIDLIYDQKNAGFKVVAGENFTDIAFQLSDETLKRDWNRLYFSIDATGRLSCRVSNPKQTGAGRVWRSKGIPLKSKCFKLVFGSCNEHNFVSRDLPPMQLRNIEIKLDGALKNAWSLAESSGTVATDSLGHRNGMVENAVWIKPKHQIWETAASLTVTGRPSFAFDPAREIVYIVTADTLYSFTARGLKLFAQPLAAAHTNLLPGNQSIVDAGTGTLYNYYPDQKEIASYDTTRHQWNNSFVKGDVTEYWQANSFITKNKYLYIIGGYGQLKYKNTIQRCNLQTGAWDTLPHRGDFFAPRYMSALGLTPSTDTAYIIGGYGSKEGDQMLSPHYFYDLLQYDVVHNRFKSMYTLPEPPASFVFGRSLVLDANGQNYYALIFSNDRFNSELQLIKGSLLRPEYTRLGSPFPYAFNDVRSYADLYYCKRTNQFLAVTLYTNKEKNSTELKINHIDFPVNEAIAAPAPLPPGNSKNFIWVAVLVAAGAAGSWLLLRRKKKAVGTEQNPTIAAAVKQNSTPVATVEPEPAAVEVHPALPEEEQGALPGFMEPLEEEEGTPRGKIRLFGQFDVTTAAGQQLTRQFSPLLKELFLLIVIDSLRYNKGVPAEKMNELLWHDKDAKDAKNNRAVNLAKIKNILEKLEGCTISRETGAWKFEFDAAIVHIDFYEYLQLFQKPGGNLTAADANKLLRICSAGAFLEQTHYEWLDPLKAEVSNFIVEALLECNNTIDQGRHREKSIAIANAIFQFDELNEHALRIKCKTLIALGRHTLAKTTYDRFSTKYKEIYGKDFEENYQSVIHV
jgi:DNA-binding SARP family transcriptional activator